MVTAATDDRNGLRTDAPAGSRTDQGPAPRSPIVAASSGSAVVLQAVSKRYAGRPALDAVDLEVRPGEVHGLLGPNGAGKTTVLRIVLGLVAPAAGTVSVLGRVPFAARGALPGVAGVVEAPGFYPYLSAAKNLDLLAALDGRRASAADVDGLLDLVGLGGRGRDKVRGFSTGMRQRLGLAAALLREPSLLVLDEPTIGLDPAGIAQLHGVVRDLAADGCAVLLSSHHMDEVEHLCDSITILRAGRRVHAGGLAELRVEAGERTVLLTTADDDLAAQEARTAGAEVVCQDGVRDGVRDGGLLVRGTQAQLDAVVLGLAGRRVPVRSLVPQESALTALFLRLTSGPEQDS